MVSTWNPDGGSLNTEPCRAYWTVFHDSKEKEPLFTGLVWMRVNPLVPLMQHRVERE